MASKAPSTNAVASILTSPSSLSVMSIAPVSWQTMWANSPPSSVSEVSGRASKNTSRTCWESMR
jgi:hypothetical protein